MPHDVIQGLWIGNELSNLERLSLSSFIANGHDYHLYVYSDVNGIPDGVTVKDGNEILPESDIFSYRVGAGKGSYSAFSNFFRYKLLYDRGGWWCDTDMVCLKPFDFQQDYVISSELHLGNRHITSGVIKSPAGSAAMKDNFEICTGKDKDSLPWGEVGPRLVSQCVSKFDLFEYVVDPEVFCPLGFLQWNQVLAPNLDLQFSEETYAVHMWNEMWRRQNLNKNDNFHANCFYEKLKKENLK